MNEPVNGTPIAPPPGMVPEGAQLLGMIFVGRDGNVLVRGALPPKEMAHALVAALGQCIAQTQNPPQENLIRVPASAMPRPPEG